MSIASVSGKNWISKEFNTDDIDFFKTNYFLDEIVAKLLSIRKINKEEVKSFLEPSIKNILPNKAYLNFPETEHIHFFGFYIGNFPDLKDEDIDDICNILNSVI